MSVLHQDPDSTPDPTPCATIGCTEPATLVGTVYDHDVIYENVVDCTFCAGYLYQQFVPMGPLRGDA